MKAETSRAALVFALALLLFGILTLFFWDFVRDAIAIPIYYLLWISDLHLKSLPQQAYLGIVIGISILIAVNTLRSVRIDQLGLGSAIQEQTSPTARYVFWRKIIMNLSVSSFSREQFVWETRKLILAILAFQEDTSEAEIETRIEDGRLPVPPVIKSLIQRQALQVQEQPVTTFRQRMLKWRDRLFQTTSYKKDPLIEQQITEIIQYIEQQLELTYART